MLFIVAEKNNTVGLNLIKYVQDLCNKNCKYYLDKLKKT